MFSITKMMFNIMKMQAITNANLRKYGVLKYILKNCHLSNSIKQKYIILSSEYNSIEFFFDFLQTSPSNSKWKPQSPIQ